MRKDRQNASRASISVRIERIEDIGARNMWRGVSAKSLDTCTVLYMYGLFSIPRLSSHNDLVPRSRQRRHALAPDTITHPFVRPAKATICEMARSAVTAATTALSFVGQPDRTRASHGLDVNDGQIPCRALRSKVFCSHTKKNAPNTRAGRDKAVDPFACPRYSACGGRQSRRARQRRRDMHDDVLRSLTTVDRPLIPVYCLPSCCVKPE